MPGGEYIKNVILTGEIPKNSYLYDLPAVRHLMAHESLPLSGGVTFFVGENGTGKSTLLEGIAVAYGFHPEGGTRNFSFASANTHSPLCEYVSLTRLRYPKDEFFLRAESFYNAATYIDQIYEAERRTHTDTLYGERSFHEQSHGESFLTLVQRRFRGNGLYLLDEPEAALSPSRLLTLLLEIHALIEQNSQFIIATHSPILMAYPGALIYQFSEDGIAPVTYQETEHYCITKRFMNNPEQMLRYLFQE